MSGRIAVVDEQNRFVRYEARRTIHEQRLPHRSIHVFVYDRAGRLFVQLRHRDKQTYPRYWDVAVSGHVEESDYLGGPDERLDEVYAQVAEREMQEELGVSAKLTFVGNFSPVAGLHYEHFAFYLATHEGPFTLQPEEVEDGRFVTGAELEQMVAAGEQVTPLLVFLVGLVAERGLAP